MASPAFTNSLPLRKRSALFRPRSRDVWVKAMPSPCFWPVPATRFPAGKVMLHPVPPVMDSNFVAASNIGGSTPSIVAFKALLAAWVRETALSGVALSAPCGGVSSGSIAPIALSTLRCPGILFISRPMACLYSSPVLYFSLTEMTLWISTPEGSTFPPILIVDVTDRSSRLKLPWNFTRPFFMT